MLGNLFNIDVDVTVLVGLDFQNTAFGIVFDEDIEEIIELFVGKLLLQFLRQVVLDEFHG